MNMQGIDWTIVGILAAILVGMAIWTRQFTRSVADFLSANRLGGRYLMTLSDTAVAMSAIGMVGAFEMHYTAGFSPIWWSFYSLPITFFIAATGFVLYRFRETRSMTFGQLFEIRYSKNFRIFMGILMWLCGIINFGIFPAVGSRFLVYFCGMPAEFQILGLQIPTLAVVMFIMIFTSLFFTYVGGQVAVMITDFIQGLFLNVSMVLIITFLFLKFDWSVVIETMKQVPEKESLLNPFHTTKIEGFNLYIFVLGMIFVFYNPLGWPGSQGYTTSAKSPHEFRMARVLGHFRALTQGLMFLLIAVFAYVAMHSNVFANIANSANSILDTISTDHADTLRKQMTVPVALSQILPVGLMGLFCGLVLSAFISTHDTYLHSYGSIFIQDVILPFRKKPFNEKQHLWLLRLSVSFVAIFIFVFGLLFRQTQYILMFFTITGSIYMSGVGAIILGGLYWKRGTTLAAWVTMIFGATTSVGTIVLQQIWKSKTGQSFPINTYYIYYGIMTGCILIYVVISFLGKTNFNIERMLHRGKYKLAHIPEEELKSARGLGAIGYSKELTKKDKLTFIIIGGWLLVWFLVFVVGSLYQIFIGISDDGWAKLWQVYIYVTFALMVIVTVWFTFGGLRDVKRLFADLKEIKRNPLDDGTVVEHKNVGEELLIESYDKNKSENKK